MSKVQRIGVSLEPKLLKWFDEHIENRGYTNRSEAIRDLIREKMIEQQWQAGSEECVAAVTLVYDHHQGDLAHKLVHLQHDHFVNVVSTLHVHIDQDNCLEVLVLRGPGKKIMEMGDKMISLRGIKHGKMITTTTGKGVP